MLKNITTDSDNNVLEENGYNCEEMAPIKLDHTETPKPKKYISGGKRLLKQLECDLSPKFIHCNSSSDGKRSRYGRQQKNKQSHDFLPIEIACSLQRIKTPNKYNKIIKKPTKRIRKSIIDDIISGLPSKILAITPLDINLSPGKPNVIFESPIEKLINKNKKLASLMMDMNKKSSNASDLNMDSLFNIVSHSKIESDMTALDNSQNKNLVINNKINNNNKNNISDNNNKLINIVTANNVNNEIIPLTMTNNAYNKIIPLAKTNNNNNEIIPLQEDNVPPIEEILLTVTNIINKKVVPLTMVNNYNIEVTSLALTKNTNIEETQSAVINDAHKEGTPLSQNTITNIETTTLAVTINTKNEVASFTVSNNTNFEETPHVENNSNNTDEISLTVTNNIDDIISLTKTNDNNNNYYDNAVTPLVMTNNNNIEGKLVLVVDSSVNEPTPLITPVNNNEIIPISTINDNIIGSNALTNKKNDNIIIDNKLKSPSPSSADSAKGSSIDIELDMLFQIGDLYWGRIGLFPYWPCMVSPCPQNTIINHAKRKVHVRFFADNGRRCWITKSCLLVFNGYEDYYEKYILPNKKANRKIKKQYQCLVNNKFKWELAITEAESLIDKPLETREELFNDILMKNRDMKKIIQRCKKVERLQSIRSSFDSLFNEHDIKFTSSTFFNNNNTFGTEADIEKHSTLKRARSPSLDVQLIEDDNLMPAKKKHLSNNQINYNLSPQYILKKPLRQYTNKRIITKLSKQNNNLTKLEENKEFKSFFNYIKTTILTNGNEKSITELKHYTEKIWALRPTNSFNGNQSDTEINIETNVKEDESITKKIEKNEERKNSTIDLITPRLDRFYLFKGLQKANVCRLCYKTKQLLKCKGPCSGWYHQHCVDFQKNGDIIDADISDDELPLAKVKELYELKNQKKIHDYHITGDSTVIDNKNENDDTIINKFLCNDCLNNIKPVCYVCKMDTIKTDDIENSNRIRCNAITCGRYFHINCLKLWPQTKISSWNDSLLCPSHVCHTCVSDDPKGKKFFEKIGTLINCVKCPSSYHYDSHCIPAGTEFITANNIICPKHTLDIKTINVNWCFICTDGGSLMCCDTCPIAMHVECLGIKGSPEGTYICEECETGRLPLYGEIVWAKLGKYRWWPAIIVPPILIPANIVQLKVNKSDFCVRFLGSTYYNYAWLNRSRVFLYQEGDWGRCPPNGYLNISYKNALLEAKQMHELIKKENQLYLNNNKIRNENNIKPIPYNKIKANRFVYPLKFNIDFDVNEIPPCYCNPNDEDPCGLSSGCINRVLLIECNPSVCPAGQKCNNQMFEKRLYPSLELVRTDGRGWGLQSLESIKTGQFIIEYVGEVIDMVEFRRRLKEKTEQRDENYYFLTINNNSLIDAGLKGNMARFINHSCQPNCETQKWTVNGHTRIGLFALVDIPANTELTFNYNLENVGDEMKKCYCGASQCAGFIGAKYNRTKEMVKKPKIEIKHKPKRKRKVLNKMKLLEKELIQNNGGMNEMEREINNDSKIINDTGPNIEHINE